MFKFLFTMKLIFWSEKGSWAVLPRITLKGNEASVLKQGHSAGVDIYACVLHIHGMYVFSYL